MSKQSNDLRHGSEMQGGTSFCRICVFMICFTLFLPIVFIARLLKLQWRPWVAGPERYRSVLNEAKAVTDTFIPFIYMA